VLLGLGPLELGLTAVRELERPAAPRSGSTRTTSTERPRSFARPAWRSSASRRTWSGASGWRRSATPTGTRSTPGCDDFPGRLSS